MGLCLTFHFDDFTIEKAFICYTTYSRQIMPTAQCISNKFRRWYVSDCEGQYIGKYCLCIYEACKVLGYVISMEEKKPYKMAFSNTKDGCYNWFRCLNFLDEHKSTQLSKLECENDGSDVYISVRNQTVIELNEIDSKHWKNGAVHQISF